MIIFKTNKLYAGGRIFTPEQTINLFVELLLLLLLLSCDSAIANEHDEAVSKPIETVKIV